MAPMRGRFFGGFVPIWWHYQYHQRSIQFHLYSGNRWHREEIYSPEENIQTYEEENVLQAQPSFFLDKSIKRKDPVFALLNREVIKAIASPLFKWMSSTWTETMHFLHWNKMLYLFFENFIQTFVLSQFYFEVKCLMLKTY